MIAQTFFCNAIFFTYAVVLTNFYDVPSYNVGWYILPFALGNDVEGLETWHGRDSGTLAANG
jgi:hypothetical protein